MIRAGVPAVSHSSAPVPSEASARPMTLPPLAVGEVTTAEIVGSGPDRHVLVALKGGRLWAEAGLPLRAGERLTVRVDRLYPTVLLRVLEEAAAGEIQTGERLRIPASQPDALLKLFDIAAVLPDAAVLPEAVKKTLTAFNERFRSLVLSNRTAGDPRFLKDYPASLGLSLERNMQRLADRSAGEDHAVFRSCKALLLRMADEIGEVHARGMTLPPGGGERLDALANLVRDAVTALDAEQLLTLVSRENEGTLSLTVPLDVPGGPALGHILIRDDESRRPAHERDGSAGAVLLLCLDALGEVAVEAGMKAGRVRCHLHCETEEIRLFITRHLNALTDRFQAAGLAVDWVDCTVGEDLARRRERSLAERMIAVRDEVNVFA